MAPRPGAAGGMGPDPPAVPASGGPGPKMPREGPGPDPANPPGSRALRVRGAGDPCLLFVSFSKAAAASAPTDPAMGLGQAAGELLRSGVTPGGRGKFSYLSVWHVSTVVLHTCF